MPGAVAILEAQIDRRRTADDAGGRAADRVQPVVHRRRRRIAAGAQRERQRLRRQVLDEFLRLLLLIEVVLQPPALEPRALVREDRDDVARLDAHVALGGVGDERRRERRGRLRRRPPARRRRAARRAAGGRVPAGRRSRTRRPVADPATGFGTGFTNSACQTYSTRNARKMARRTRRSIQQVRLQPDATSGAGTGS